MVVSVTPSTVKVGFVSVMLGASYHIKLTSNKRYNAAALHPKKAKIQAKILSCMGITLKALYQSLSVLIALLASQGMRHEGLPIGGLLRCWGYSLYRKGCGYYR
jgi:enoyl reductase-like protein